MNHSKLQCRFVVGKMQNQNDRSNDLHKLRVGLMAHGQSNNWELSIDETIDGEDRWFAQLEGPSANLYFEISSPRVIVDLVSFLECSEPKLIDNPVEITIGDFGGNPVTLLRDDEFQDRCFLCIQSNRSSAVRIGVAGSDLNDLSNAARQLKMELFPGE